MSKIYMRAKKKRGIIVTDVQVDNMHYGKIKKVKLKKR